MALGRSFCTVNDELRHFFKGRNQVKERECFNVFFHAIIPNLANPKEPIVAMPEWEQIEHV